MRLRRITLSNVRRFTDPVTVDGIGDGLNVLSEPNEFGKSTVFDALQALFFKPHGSKDRGIKALQPHAGGAPEVSVDVELPEGSFTLTKRWISKPEARVSQGGRLVAQADAAEDWIARTLGGAEGGPSGLLWVRQGMTGLTSGTRKEDADALEARRDLMSSVSHEVEEMTGGRRMDAALARCRDELAVLATSTGRPRTGGPWKEAQDRVASLEEEVATLSQTAAALHDALNARRRLRRELAEIEDPEAVQARADRLAVATRAQADASQHAEEIDAARRARDAAGLAVSRTQERLGTLRDQRAEHAAAEEAARRDEAEYLDALAKRDAASDRAEAAQTALDEALAEEADAEVMRRRVERQVAAKAGVARKAELADRIRRAESARATVESARVAARQGPDAKALRMLDILAAARDAAKAARDATATQVVMRYEPGQDGRVRHEGDPLADGHAMAVPRRTRLALDGIGTLEIQPGAGVRDGSDLQEAEAVLATALSSQGCSDLEHARALATRREDAQRRMGEAAAIFESLAPEGLDPLRAALAAIPDPGEETVDEADTDPERAEARYMAAVDARRTAQAARDTAAERMSEMRSAVARTDAARGASRDRVARAETGLKRLESNDTAALSATLDTERAALGAAAQRLEELSRAAPDLDAAEAALARAQAVERAARETVDRLRPEIARLDERISRASGDAVEERLAETMQRLDRARADLDRITYEVAVLRRLESALETARSEARDRYFAPVAAELRPLLGLLWPEADLTWAEDTLLPTALVRNGTEEPIDILSGGTQEQVALLVRLAFARMLSRAGRHAPVILDDALVFTDDDRIERMFDALHRQADDLQIIVLSCRQRAFRDLGGRVLKLTF